MSDTRKYRKFSAQQKTEIVLASLRGPKSMAELCREHDIADSLLRKWREQFLAAGAERLQGRQERTEADELRRQIGRLERALGRKTLEVEVALPAAIRVKRVTALSPQGGGEACSCAHTASCTRLRSPSLRRIWLTCHLAVVGVITSARAISAFVCPRATSAATSRSRSLRCCWKWSGIGRRLRAIDGEERRGESGLVPPVPRIELAQLLAQIPLQADLLDRLELGFQPVDIDTRLTKRSTQTQAMVVVADHAGEGDRCTEFRQRDRAVRRRTAGLA